MITLGSNVRPKYVKISAPATGIAWNMDCAHAAEDGKARTVAKLFAHRKDKFADCSGHGTCIQHVHPIARNGSKKIKSMPKCFCTKGYTGAACNLKTCSKECEDSPHSDCHDGVCYCKQGFGGDFVHKHCA